jgi:hypothetical protein
MESMVVNLQTYAVTEFVNFKFLSVYTVNGVTYGVREDGVYIINKQHKNDAGVPILARFVTGFLTLANNHHKRVLSVYYDQVEVLNSPISAIIRYDGKQDLVYEFSQKVVPGKGASGYAVAFGAEGVTPFSVYGITYILGERQRRGG